MGAPRWTIGSNRSAPKTYTNTTTIRTPTFRLRRNPTSEHATDWFPHWLKHTSEVHWAARRQVLSDQGGRDEVAPDVSQSRNIVAVVACDCRRGAREG